MPEFHYEFTVSAPLADVAAFHADTSALQTLNPPPIRVELHRVDPLSEGSVSEFTLWFGPLPIHWTAVHSEVSERGFTDTMSSGPARSWRHRHQFDPIDTQKTLIREHIIYAYGGGREGILARLLFNPLNLLLLFGYRKWATRRALRKLSATKNQDRPDRHEA